MDPKEQQHRFRPRKYPYPEYPSIQQASEKWGKMGKMGENGKLLQIHHGKCMKLFHQERKMEENGVEMGGKWVKNGTRAGPIFPKGRVLPHRAVNKKPSIQVSGWKNGENGGIRKTGYFLGLPVGHPKVRYK